MQDKSVPARLEPPGTRHRRASLQCEDETVARRATHRPTPPTLAAIADAWANLSIEELRATFPNHRAPGIGWGEPMCFRCGWLPPVKDTASYPKSWKSARTWDAAWNGASPWLEKAHLHDHAEGGSNDPLNFVAMCVLCHGDQPACRTREEGIAFVNSTPRYGPTMRIMAGFFMDGCYRDRKPVDRGEALRLMLRAYAEVGQALLESLGGEP